MTEESLSNDSLKFCELCKSTKTNTFKNYEQWYGRNEGHRYCYKCYCHIRRSKIEKIFCECGCKTLIPKYKHDGTLQHFANHHYSKGSRHPNWSGGRTKDKRGYIYIWKPDHPFADYKGRVKEHRLVMEEHLGRYLTKNEVVHHRNHNPKDNRIENLGLYETHGKHMNDHKKDMSARLCAICNNKKTFVSKKGNHVWYKHKTGFMCARCYNRSRINKTQ